MINEWEHIAHLWVVVEGVFRILLGLIALLAIFAADWKRSGLPPEDPRPDGSFNWLSKGKRHDSNS